MLKRRTRTANHDNTDSFEAIVTQTLVNEILETFNKGKFWTAINDPKWPWNTNIVNSSRWIRHGMG